jgi:hypothetical protein
MDQQALFHEDINDALRAAVKACGGTKRVAALLWPEKTQADAHSYLNDCLNSARPAKLSPEQVILLLKWAHEQGFHGAFNYIAGECGYRAEPVEPRDELTQMLADYLRIRKQGDSLENKIDDRIAKLRVA